MFTQLLDKKFSASTLLRMQLQPFDKFFESRHLIILDFVLYIFRRVLINQHLL